MSTPEITQLRESMEEMKFMMEGVEGNQDKILQLLQGNPLDKEDRGMIGKINNHGKRLLNLEKFKDRGIYMVIGISIGTGVGISKLIEILIKK
jgi:hypothetical protein